MRATALITLCGAALVSAELKSPTMPRMLPTLTPDDLLKELRALGYQPTARDGGAASITFTDPDNQDNNEQKSMDLAWGEDNTLALRAAWNSPHTELGDLPIVNTWNKMYRFAKAAIQDNPSGESPTVIIMHMDQFVHAEGGEKAVRSTVKKSVDLFKASVFAFDKFIRDVYTQAREKEKKEKAI
eukprot:TRINITY_DN8392_c0_g1_i1.p2 TRINITY_DN8392_c0_g1~~TRINITY_DN8392_c0_g1_i1.p2  ORF type:complete len:185 (+),score=86.33 TRINITY_DN8392_c0_g1_i1:116-670(+)